MSNTVKMSAVNISEEEQKKTEEISRTSIIGDIIAKYPYSIEVFMDYGIHCVGCSASSFETMEQGILGHGFSEGELFDILNELNELIFNPPENFEELVF